MQDFQLVQQLGQAFTNKVKQAVIDLDNILVDRNSFSLVRVEELYARTKGLVPPYRQSDFLIIFVKTGEGKRSIGPYTYPVKANSLAIIPQRIIHASSYTSPPTGYFITFNPDFFLQQAFSYKLLNNKKVLKPSHSSYLVLNKVQADVITGIFEQIIGECDSRLEEGKQMIALKLLELLVLCDRYISDEDHPDGTHDYSTILQTFNDLIEHHFAKHHDVHFYANALHTHPNNLNHIVKKETGLTAKQTIIKRLIFEARYLLVATTLSVKEIAYQLGFEDPNYFISFFKKEQSVTPVDFRKRNVSFSR
jgi:AraC-like DNA-binding protein